MVYDAKEKSVVLPAYSPEGLGINAARARVAHGNEERSSRVAD